MAKYWTLLEIKTKIKADMDLEAEDFIQPSELLDLINEAIDDAEAEIHGLGLEDNYFLTYTDISLTVDQEFIDLPTDIYAHKILGMIYDDDALIYTLRRFRGANKFEIIANAQHFTNTGDYYKYIMVNDNSDAGATPAPKLLLVPKSRVTKANVIRMWYIRNCHRLAVDTDICDFPEFVHYIIKHVKWHVYYKEGHPNTQAAKQELLKEEQKMKATLATMIPDKDSTITPDLSFYNEGS